MNPIVYAIPVFMLTILIEALLARRWGRKLYDLADAVTSLNFGILSQVSAAFTRLLGLGVYALVHEHLRWLSLPVDSLWVWLFALLCYDFLYYWVHRCGHEVQLMWASHQVHHSSEYFNLSTALRQSATGVFFSWPFYLPMALLGVPPVVFAVVALIDLLYQYWVHTELVGRLGPLDRIFVTPSNHRVHHGQNEYCIDRNYGGILIIWDRLFGTFAAERANETVVYGIRKPLGSFNALWGNFNVFVDLWRRSAAAADWRSKLGIWFGRPSSAGQTLGEALQPIRWRSLASTRAQGYVLLQYVLLGVIATVFFAVANTLDTSARIAFALWILWSVGSLGALLDAHRLARRLETLRVIVTLALAASFMETWLAGL